LGNNHEGRGGTGHIPPKALTEGVKDILADEGY